MKKYLLGIFAIVLAISFSAFTNENKSPKKLPVNYVWFDVNPSAPSQTVLTNSNVTFNSSLSGAPSSNPSGCTTSNTYICTVGFNASQVDGTSLKPGNQTIQSTYYKRSTQ